MLKRIIQLCEENGISIRSLEDRCELGNGTILKWKNHSPSVANLQKVADYFEVPITFFLEGGEGDDETTDC